MIYIIMHDNFGISTISHVASKFEKAIEWIKLYGESFTLDDMDTFSISQWNVDDIEMNDMRLIGIYDEKGEEI